jgi:hypothetical protein
MRNISVQTFGDNQKIFMSFRYFFRINIFYVIMWKVIVQPKQDIDINLIRSMIVACCYHKATNKQTHTHTNTHTHTEHEIFIACPLHQ